MIGVRFIACLNVIKVIHQFKFKYFTFINITSKNTININFCSVRNCQNKNPFHVGICFTSHSYIFFTYNINRYQLVSINIFASTMWTCPHRIIRYRNSNVFGRSYLCPSKVPCCILASCHSRIGLPFI